MMKTEYIGAFQVPDGYFGEKAIVHLCFDLHTFCTIEVRETGYFRSCIPQATTKEEVEWLMKNNPTCKGRYKSV